MNRYRVRYTQIKPGGHHDRQDDAVPGTRADVVDYLKQRNVLRGSVRVTENVGGRSDATGVDIGGLGFNDDEDTGH